MANHALRIAALAALVTAACEQSGSRAAGPAPPRTPVAAPAAAATPAIVDPRTLSENLSFTGALSGRVTNAVATDDCGPRDDASGHVFEGSIEVALADGMHALRVRWADYPGPGISVAGSSLVFVDVSPVGSSDTSGVAGSYRATAPVSLKVAADERSGTVDADYVGVGGQQQFTGQLPTPPPILGHLTGTWRCGK